MLVVALEVTGGIRIHKRSSHHDVNPNNRRAKGSTDILHKGMLYSSGGVDVPTKIEGITIISAKRNVEDRVLHMGSCGRNGHGGLGRQKVKVI